MPRLRYQKSTIKEVAARAGVSTTTISLFVSGREGVCSPDTAARIRAAVADLHYTPSSLTRGLRRKASMTFGVCLPNPLDADLAYGSSFFEQLWRGIMYQADRENYALLHFPLAVRKGTSCDAFLDGRVDAMLLQDQGNVRALRLAAAGMPTVLLARSLDLPDGCGAVCTDEGRTADLALSHLWALGHRRIAHIAGPAGARAPRNVAPATVTARWCDDVGVQRLDGYMEWMGRRGAFDPALVSYAQAWSAPQAPDMLDGWLALAHPPTAAFCANDAQARDLIAAAWRRGLRVPQDFSIVGVDNSSRDVNGESLLTSVDAGLEENGREAVRALLRLMSGDPAEECRVALPPARLVIRHSAAPSGRMT
ncbi:MAG: LacI family DNA-binding transcriptional regulator [Armatimonadetes bacterium]|nr:LacI family DNA-binding transcriptional regulator [Armatimonadota bacterium]